MASTSTALPAESDILGDPLAGAQPFALTTFDESRVEHSGTEADASFPNDLEVQIELGRASVTREEADALREGSIVSLDKLETDPVDILVGGRLVARGEVLVLGNNFCVRIAE